LTETARTLEIVASCTDRKKVQPQDDLQLGSIPGGPTQRLAEWRRRLRHSDAPRVRAGELYQGQHWKRITEAVDIARSRGWSTRLWILSAGLGLLPSNGHIVSYSATFASGTRDSVWRGRVDGSRADTLRWWWRSLTEAELPSLSAAASGPVVIVAGRTYIDAITEDLERIASDSSSASRVVIVSTGLDHPLGLRYDHRISAQVGGTLGSLNAALLRALAVDARNHGWHRDGMQKAVDRLMARAVDPVPAARQPCSDAQVVDYLTELRSSTPRITRSRALRALRDDGMACSQERFARLWSC